MKRFVCYFVPVFFLCIVSLPKSEGAEIEANTSQFVVWLGKQTNSGPIGHFRSIVDSSGSSESDWRWENIKDSLDIQLRIIAGYNVRRVSRADRSKVYQELPQTKNGYTTLINGEVGSVKDQAELQIRHNSLYVVGIVKQTKGVGRIRSLNARITRGPLTNAVVHLRDNTWNESMTDPFVAVYKIPEHIEVTEGDLEFRVIRVVEK